MKLTELIGQLETAKEQYGDVEVDMACAEEPEEGGLSVEIAGIAYFADDVKNEAKVTCITICDEQTIDAMIE